MLEDIVRLQDNNRLKRQLEETEISLGSRVRKKKMEEKVNGAKSKDDKPKTFLEHTYPDGVGPDTDLIAMLERDVIDKSPNVSFNDIAGLNDCKKCLKEAVLLPILMP